MSEQNQNNGNVVGKVLAGAAVVGAGIVAAKVVSDHKEEIKEGLQNAKEKGTEIIETLRTKFEDLKSNIEKSPYSDELKDKVNKVADALKEIKDSNPDNVDELVSEVRKQVEELKGEFDTKQKA